MFFLLSVFWITQELFQDSLVSVIAMFLIGLGQPVFVYLTAFGGIPQLCAVIGYNIGMVALWKINRNRATHEGWILLAMVWVFITFAHFPSAPIFFCITAAGLLAFRKTRENFLQTFYLSLRYLSIPTLLWLLYFFLFFDQLVEYGINRAGYYRTGVDAIIDFLIIDKWMFSLNFLAIASTAVIGILARTRNIHFPEGVARFLYLWVIVPLVFMLGSHFWGVGTIYQRFMYFFLQPLFISVACLVGLIVRQFQRFFWILVSDGNNRSFSFFLSGLWLILSFLGIAFFVVNSSYFTFDFYRESVRYFSVKDSKSFQEVVDWLKETRDQNAVFADFPESVWIEGLTGQESIFSKEFRYLYRPGEVDRTLAADAINTGSTLTIENGFIYLRLQDIDGDFPFDPNIATYSRGEYVDLFTLQDHLILVSASVNGKHQELNLSKDFTMLPETPNLTEQSGAHITRHYMSDVAGFEIQAVKTIFVPKNSSEISIQFDFVPDSQVSIEKVDIHIEDVFLEKHNEFDTQPINTSGATLVLSNAQQFLIQRVEEKDNIVGAQLTFSPEPTTVTNGGETSELSDPYLSLSYSGQREKRLSFQLLIHPQVNERFRPGIRVKTLFELLESYNVNYIVTKREEETLQSVYTQYGFPIAYSNRGYSVYQVPNKSR
jgi:hypothetical protein